MQKLKLGLIAIAMVATFGVTQHLRATPRPQNPDNTKTNERDRNKNEPTADQQKENDSDRELARKIRRSVVSDKSLSTDAHNIKIIAQDGNVTLKGPVKSEEEKQALESKAAEVAGGPDHVKSEIEVKASGRNNSQ
jgi:hyperosmotically inducible periplasmic protein